MAEQQQDQGWTKKGQQQEPNPLGTLPMWHPCKCGHEMGSHKLFKGACCATLNGSHQSRCRCAKYRPSRRV